MTSKGETSDNLRLMPRFAEEDYQSSIKDAFFGANSIEAWFLGSLAKIIKTPGTINQDAIELACRELNANVACPGIAQNSDNNTVKIVVTGLLVCLNKAVVADVSNDRVDNTRAIISMLQSLFRITTRCATPGKYSYIC